MYAVKLVDESRLLAQGVCEGLTYEEIKHNFPHELTARDLDKFRYAFPMGEVQYCSYFVHRFDALFTRVHCSPTHFTLQST